MDAGAGGARDHGLTRRGPRSGRLGDVPHHRAGQRTAGQHPQLHRREVLDLVHHDVAVLAQRVVGTAGAGPEQVPGLVDQCGVGGRPRHLVERRRPRAPEQHLLLGVRIPGGGGDQRRGAEEVVEQLVGDRRREPDGHGVPRLRGPVRARRREFDFEDFSRKVRRVPALARALDRMWPRLVTPRAAPRPLWRPAADQRRRPGDPDTRGTGPALSPPVGLLRRGAVDFRRRCPGRRGPAPPRTPQRGSDDAPASTAISWSTRSRTSRPCSCGC